jgi:translin
MSNLDILDSVADHIRESFEAKNTARDAAINQSRTLIQHCANAIRAVHRHEWDAARARLDTVRQAADQLRAHVADYPDLYHSGYTQDALREYVEAFSTYALARGEDLSTPEALGVEPSAYLNGLAEAASELRRHVLDIIRKGHSDEAERLLDTMDTIYGVLMAFDFHDAITGGLRRRVDALRAVLERTRGDVTNSLRQQQLQAALADLERRIGLDDGDQPGDDMAFLNDESDDSAG